MPENNQTDNVFDILGAIEVPSSLEEENKTVEKQPIATKEVKEKKIEKTPVLYEETQTDTETNIDEKKETKKAIELTIQKALEEEKALQKESEKTPSITIPSLSFDFSRFISAGIFGVKYVITSAFIFGVLLLSTNYSAYLNIAKSYVYEDEIAQESSSLLNGVDASSINTEEKVVTKKSKQERVNELIEQEKKINIKEDAFSMKNLVSTLNKENVDLGIDIVPYENRIVIPKIGKNVPLIDIKESKVESESQLNNIFMKELEYGVVRYPGSAKPGEKGNSFIFGHSSNFPWIAGNYNDVFSRLGQMKEGDIVFSYYGQKKYKYKIKERKIISPNEVDILKRNKDAKELTLMTCWPVGTTLNRLILIGEIIEE